MKIIRKINQIIKKIFKKTIIKPIENILLYFFRKLPIQENSIVLESEGDYWDNARAFYEYLIVNNLNKKYKIIWFVDEPKIYPVQENVVFVTRSSYGLNMRAVYYIATSKCFIFTHPWWLKKWRENQVVINTTHSTMALKAGSSIDISDTFDYIMCASESAKEIKRKTYHASDAQMIILGAPRNDLLYDKSFDMLKLFPKWNGEKIILSMTTFRQSVGSQLDSNLIDKYSLNVINNYEELLDLNVFLLDNHLYLVIKIHHLQDLSFLDKGKLSNIFYLQDKDLQKIGLQLYQLLGKADILLTDYSSVFYDYLFTKKPIGFLVSDIADYSRGFCVENPLNEMPGKKIFNYPELKGFFLEILNGEDNYFNSREQLKEKIHFYQDNRNSERLLLWLIENKILSDT